MNILNWIDKKARNFFVKQAQGQIVAGQDRDRLGRKIGEDGVPEGCKPSTDVTYIDTDGTERFRYNLGQPIRRFVTKT